MRFRHIFYVSLVAGFIAAFGAYVYISAQAEAEEEVLGSQVDEERLPTRQEDPQLLPEVVLYHSVEGEYSIARSLEWSLDSSDPTLVVMKQESGGRVAMIDAVPEALSHTTRMERIRQLRDMPIQDLDVVSETPARVGTGTWYGENILYFVETIASGEDVRYQYSMWIDRPNRSYVLTVSDPVEKDVATLKLLHHAVFSSFVFDDSPLSCPDGLIPFHDERVWLCRPDHVVFDTTELPNRVVFSSNRERLIVEASSDQSWPIHLCNLNSDITVGEYDAVRTLFREDTGSGCGAIIGFATKIETGGDKPWFIGLLTDSGVYDDESLFAHIEQSVQIQ